MAIIKRPQITYTGKDVEKRKSSHTADGNENVCNHYGKQYGDFSKNKNLKIDLSYNPAILLLEIYPKTPKSSDSDKLNKISAPQCQLQHYLQIAKTEKPKCPSMDKQIKKLWYICTMEYYSALEKKEILPFETT